MTYLETLKIAVAGEPGWMDVIAECNRQRPNTFGTAWDTGKTTADWYFEEYPAHWVLHEPSSLFGPGARTRIVAKTEEGARILRYAAFEVGALADHPLRPTEEHLDFTPIRDMDSAAPKA